MKNFDEYVHFVVGAKIAGQVIECGDSNNKTLSYSVLDSETSIWNWMFFFYRIKLPKGWDYVIKDGDIAFREPEVGEWIFGAGYIPREYVIAYGCAKKPIIKRIKTP